MTSVEYEVITPVGKVLLTTPDLKLARKFRRSRMKKVAGLRLFIEEIETTKVRRRVPARPSRVEPAPRLHLVGR
jgi:hypothetical protein